RRRLEDRAHPKVRRLHSLAAQGRREAERAEQQDVLRMEAEGGGAASFVPPGADLATLASAAKRCQGCPLYRDATQTVFGRGPAQARVVLVGEQPGDQEDLRDAPFVGPAGEVRDRALAEVHPERRRRRASTGRGPTTDDGRRPRPTPPQPRRMSPRASGPTLPPESTTPTRAPAGSGRRPESTAAAATAPVGSATTCARRARNRTA